MLAAAAESALGCVVSDLSLDCARYHRIERPRRGQRACWRRDVCVNHMRLPWQERGSWGEKRVDFSAPSAPRSRAHFSRRRGARTAPRSCLVTPAASSPVLPSSTFQAAHLVLVLCYSTGCASHCCCCCCWTRPAVACCAAAICAAASMAAAKLSGGGAQRPPQWRRAALMPACAAHCCRSSHRGRSCGDSCAWNMESGT